MKNRPFHLRLGYAIQGLKIAWKSETSFRTQTKMAMGAIALLLILRPEPIWWAIFCLAMGGVLSAEMLNTALEALIDRIHPERHPMIARAKDCAAGAVLVMSLVSLAVAAAMVYDSLAKH